MAATEPVYIGYLNYIGSGAPSDGDQITRDNSQYPLNCVYTDKETGISYVRKATTLAATDWQASSGGTTGGGGVTEVTYTELVALIGSNGLTAGGQYLITDFQTVHYIIDANSTQYLDTIITGETEGLIVTAITTNLVSKEAKSILYPQDTIYYDWNPVNWLKDVSFATGGVIVDGFKGVIHFRHDTFLDNSFPYDFRNCKFRRWKHNTTVWSNATTYAKNAFVVYNGSIYRALKGANTNNTPAGTSAWWVQVIDLFVTEYVLAAPSSWLNIPSNDADFIDLKTFVESGTTGTYDFSVRNVHFSPFPDNTDVDQSNSSILLNNVFFLGDNSAYNAYAIRIDGYGHSNTFLNAVFEIEAAHGFRQNIVGSMSSSQIGADYNQNINYYTFNDNTIASSFAGNYVGDSFTQNRVEDACFQNTFGKGMVSNVIGAGFYGNTVGHGFKSNNVSAGAAVFGSSIDFTAATHVYAGYNTWIFLNESLAAKLSYYNTTNTLTVVNANA